MPSIDAVAGVRSCDNRPMSAPIPLDRHLFGRGQRCFGCWPEHPTPLPDAWKRFAR
jgi:hypothetical protein